MSKSRKPFDPKNIELVIFGPGYGECILFHYGDNNWIIIDSCVQEKKTAALNYFKNHEINPTDSVRMIIATHWHDDHIRGLGEIVEECSNAFFVFSSALGEKEFIELISVNGGSYVPIDGIKEFNKILNILNDRNQEIRLAAENKCLLKDNSQIGKCEVHSLSPSDASVLLALQKIGNLPNENENKKDIIALEPNYLSVVIWIKLNETNFLFGSDLQNLNNSIGWQRIVESKERPNGVADVFKVPHHGSPNAFYREVWEKMLIKNAYALVTPFNRGHIKRPSNKDISIINELTANGFITAQAVDKKIKHDKLVDKLLKDAVKSIRVIDYYCGFVRLIREEDQNWQVELNGSAGFLNRQMAS